jgi:hypothetical protein
MGLFAKGHLQHWVDICRLLLARRASAPDGRVSFVPVCREVQISSVLASGLAKQGDGPKGPRRLSHAATERHGKPWKGLPGGEDLECFGLWPCEARRRPEGPAKAQPRGD